MISVPTVTDEDLTGLLAKISSNEKPRYVPCRPIPNAPINECFPLVEKAIALKGGKRVLGWQIWKNKLLIESEFHAIWEKPNGECIDITPKIRPFSEILFIPDSKATYTGEQVNNIRINITGNKLVDEFILICDTIFRIENKGERALQYELHLKGKEAQAHRILTNAKKILEMMALKGLTKSSSCPCGSNKKYKSCHGKLSKKILNSF